MNLSLNLMKLMSNLKKKVSAIIKTGDEVPEEEPK
jgi:hypothetical protein